MAISIYCAYALLSQDVANNITYAEFRVDMQSTGASYNLYGMNGTATLGGNLNWSEGFTCTIGRCQYKRIYTEPCTIHHNADGTAYVTGNVSVVTGVSSGTVYASTSWSPPTIPRASKLTFDTVEPTLGGNLVIYTNRASSAFTHTLRYRYNYGANTGTIATNVGSSYTWQIPMSIANTVTSSTSLKIAIIVDTYNGGTLIGTTERSDVYIQFPSSMVPKIDSWTLSDTGKSSAIFAKKGEFTQSISVLKNVVTASGVYGSTITKYELSYNGGPAKSSTDSTFSLSPPEVFTNAGTNIPIKLTITDTRGRTASTTKNVTVLPYSPPNLKGSWVKRWDLSKNEESDESDTVRVYVAGEYSNPGGYGLNKIENCKLFTKAPSDEDFEEYAKVGWNSTTNLTGIFPAEKRGQIKIEAYDTLNSTVKTSITIDVDSAKPVMDFKSDGTGMAILGISDRPGLKVNGAISITSGNTISLENSSEKDTPFLTVRSDGRPLIENHTALANGMYLQGETSSGDFSNILAMNANDQVELSWTTGGLKGRVMKKLWSGTFTSGSITIGDLPYYNYFVAYVSSDQGNSLADTPVLLMRNALNTQLHGFGGVASSSGNTITTSVNLGISGTKLTYISVLRAISYGNQSYTNMAILSLYGLL